MPSLRITLCSRFTSGHLRLGAWEEDKEAALAALQRNAISDLQRIKAICRLERPELMLDNTNTLKEPRIGARKHASKDKDVAIESTSMDLKNSSELIQGLSCEV